MALYSYEGRQPAIGRDCFVADSAQIIGDVVVGDGCYVGHGAVLRGDYGGMRIGEGSAIEECAVLHVPPQIVMTLGERVTVGHGAVCHGLSIGHDVVLGMGSVVSWNCTLGPWCILAEGGVLPTNRQIPEGKLLGGVPARILGDVTEENRTFWTWGKQLYRDLARDMPEKLRRLD